jgi:DNA processing protein
MHTSSGTSLDTLLLTLLPNIGIHRYWSLIEYFGSAGAVLSTSPDTIPLFNPAACQLVREYQQHKNNSPLMQSALQILDTVDQQKGKITTIEEDHYPALLKEIHHPPPLLYSKGSVDLLSLPQLAIVGSRHATYSGLQNTQLFAKHLSQHGFVITSGLALGVDGAAHQAVLSSQGKTVAVMATGIDTVYPKKHRYMADKIVAEGGTLVTEFPPSTSPKANHFPRRNRIISGLSLGVIVVEAAIKSGSLITAKYAIEQDREVFAIPGSIHNPQSKGCHQLIKQGATLIESSQDIVDHLGGMLAHIQLQTSTSHLQPVESVIKADNLSPDETTVMQYIGFEPTSVDQLIQASQLDSQRICSCLINLELIGHIKRSDWGYERV